MHRFLGPSASLGLALLGTGCGIGTTALVRGASDDPAAPALELLGREPDAGATEVDPTARVVLTFSRSLHPPSADGFALERREPDRTWTPVPFGFSAQASEGVVTLTPGAPLHLRALHRVTLDADVRASDGSALASDTQASWSFRVADGRFRPAEQVDFGETLVLDTAPRQGATPGFVVLFLQSFTVRGQTRHRLVTLDLPERRISLVTTERPFIDRGLVRTGRATPDWIAWSERDPQRLDLFTTSATPDGGWGAPGAPFANVGRKTDLEAATLEDGTAILLWRDPDANVDSIGAVIRPPEGQDFGPPRLLTGAQVTGLAGPRLRTSSLDTDSVLACWVEGPGPRMRGPWHLARAVLRRNGGRFEWSSIQRLELEQPERLARLVRTRSGTVVAVGTVDGGLPRARTVVGDPGNGPLWTPAGELPATLGLGVVQVGRTGPFEQRLEAVPGAEPDQVLVLWEGEEVARGVPTVYALELTASPGATPAWIERATDLVDPPVPGVAFVTSLDLFVDAAGAALGAFSPGFAGTTSLRTARRAEGSSEWVLQTIDTTGGSIGRIRLSPFHASRQSVLSWSEHNAVPEILSSAFR